MNDLNSLAFAALGAVFALLAGACYLRCRSLVKELNATSQQIRSSFLKSEAAEARVEELADAFLRLRGKFYATRRESQLTSSNSDAPGEATADVTSPPPNDAGAKAAWKAKMRQTLLVKPNR